MANRQQTTLDGLALSPSAGGVKPLEMEAPAFRLPVRRSLRMHPLLAAGVAAFALLVLLGFVVTRKPVYRAESRIYVEPIPTTILGETGVGTYDTARYESFLQEQMETVQRPDILLAALNSMPEGMWRRPGEKTSTAVARLLSALRTERVTTSYQLAISVGASTPEVSAAMTNAVTRAYLDAGQKDSKAVSAGRLQLLKEERSRLSSEMDTLRTEQGNLSASLGMANPSGAGGDAFDTQLANAREALGTAQQAHDAAAAQLSSLTGPGGRPSAGAAATAEETVQADPGVSSLRISMNQRRAALLTQMNGMKPANPLYQADQGELAQLDQQLTGVSSGLQAQVEQRMEARLRQDLQRTAEVEARLNSEVNRETATAAGAGPKLQRSTELTADMARLQLRYAAVDDSVRSLQLETSAPGMAHLAVAASVPSLPEPSKSRVIGYVALPLALLLGLAAALLAQKMDDRVYTAGDLEDVLGFAPVGILPVPSEVSEGVTDEYLLRLTAALESAYRGAAARSFVFTAASAEAGLETDIENIRRKLEELGFTSLALPASQIMRTGGDVVGAGHEGYASARLEELKHSFDLILIDAYPLLHSAEAEYAARCCDAVILVVQSGVSTRHELNLASSLLRRLQASGVGTLLRGVSLAQGEPEYRESIAVLERREASGKTQTKQAAQPAVVKADFSDCQPMPVSEPAVEFARLAEPETLAAEGREINLSSLDTAGKEEEFVEKLLPDAEALSPTSDEVAFASAGSWMVSQMAEEWAPEGASPQELEAVSYAEEQVPAAKAGDRDEAEATEALGAAAYHVQGSPSHSGFLENPAGEGEAVAIQEPSMFERLFSRVEGVGPVAPPPDEPALREQETSDREAVGEPGFELSSVQADSEVEQADESVPAFQEEHSKGEEGVPAVEFPATEAGSDTEETVTPQAVYAAFDENALLVRTSEAEAGTATEMEETPEQGISRDREAALPGVNAPHETSDRETMPAFSLAGLSDGLSRSPMSGVRRPPKAWRIVDQPPAQAVSGTYGTGSRGFAVAGPSPQLPRLGLSGERATAAPRGVRQWTVLSRFNAEREPHEDGENEELSLPGARTGQRG